MLERGLYAAEVKEHMSFKCDQKTHVLLIEDDSPDSVFAFF